MALELPFGLKVLNPLPVDDKYLSGGTPYTSVSAVNTAIPEPIRHQGLTVNINGVEYWYKDGVTDGDLVLKTTGGGTAASGERIEKRYTGDTSSFTVGTAVGYSGGTFVEALATTDFDGEVLGIVSEIDSPTGFTVVFAGYVTGLTSYGFSPNTTYFLSNVVEGGYVTTAPSSNGSIIKPMLTTFSGDDALVFQYLGVAVTTGVTGGGSGVTDGTNSGGGAEVFSGLTDSGATMVYRTLVGTGGTEITTVGDKIYISGGSSTSKVVGVWTMTDTITDEDIVAFSGVSGTSYNVTLPASPETGKEITISDISGEGLSSNITILGGTESILDGTTVINTSYGTITLLFMGMGWKIKSFLN